jgi:hypothetical protein
MIRRRTVTASIVVAFLIGGPFYWLHLRHRAEEQRYQAAVRKLVEQGN